MQLPRVIIAAVFFVIGALIAIPALTHSSSSHTHTSANTTSETPTPTLTATPSPSTSGTHSSKPGGTKSKTPTTGAHSATPGTSARPSVTLTPPTSVPLTASFSSVGCPSREVRVTVKNTGAQPEDYVVVQDGSVVLANRITAEATQTNSITLEQGVTSHLSVVWNTHTVRTVARTADCSSTGPSPAPSSRGKLPFTGTNAASLTAKIATGVAAMITGVIIFWWGGMWPRRKESMYGPSGPDGKPGRNRKSPDKVSR
jgi:hypothetical protein